jgi:nucleoside-triphosphatase THEP1
LTTELERYKSLYQKTQDYELKYKDYEVRIRDYENRITFLRNDYEEKTRKLVDEIGKLN